MIELLIATLNTIGLLLVFFNMFFSIYHVLVKRDWQYITRREFFLTVLILVLIAEFFIRSGVMIVNLIVLALFVIYLVLFLIKIGKVGTES